eukprot:4915350-Karenia_brevis.AAC.1
MDCVNPVGQRIVSVDDNVHNLRIYDVKDRAFRNLLNGGRWSKMADHYFQPSDTKLAGAKLWGTSLCHKPEHYQKLPSAPDQYQMTYSLGM